MSDELVLSKLHELELWQRKVHLQAQLPHLPENGWKLYQWAQDYWHARNKIQLICAGNQISKSSTQIRKHIHWATATDLWPSLWPTTPRQFWYLYPTRDVAHIEFKKKWEPEFMPRGEFKDHPQYGWKAEFYHNRIFAIHWNSGISTYFKTYKQNVQDLQTGSVHKLDTDEEPPEEIMGELFLRMAATDGYFSAVFTPTIGQEYWRQAIEEIGTKHERFPDAFKRQVSMYDCLKYADGSPSSWTVAKIKGIEQQCKSPQEIDMRVNGKFVIAEGLKYPSFHRLRNRKPGHPIPKSWSVWVGVDPGSGGDNHPAAIALVGVSPDWKHGRVFNGWRGDNQITTAGDIVHKVIEMTKGLDNVQIYYDWGCRDFYTIASNMGLQVEPAEKSHAVGETVLNVLFKNQMLYIYDYPQLDPLCIELATLKTTTAKNSAKDDFVDALRYACAKTPWNWESLVEAPKSLATKEEKKSLLGELEARRRAVKGERDEGPRLVTIEDEFAAWNELLEPDYLLG